MRTLKTKWGEIKNKTNYKQAIRDQNGLGIFNRNHKSLKLMRQCLPITERKYFPTRNSIVNKITLCPYQHSFNPQVLYNVSFHLPFLRKLLCSMKSTEWNKKEEKEISTVNSKAKEIPQQENWLLAFRESHLRTAQARRLWERLLGKWIW